MLPVIACLACVSVQRAAGSGRSVAGGNERLHQCEFAFEGSHELRLVEAVLKCGVGSPKGKADFPRHHNLFQAFLHAGNIGAWRGIWEPGITRGIS